MFTGDPFGWGTPIPHGGETTAGSGMAADPKCVGAGERIRDDFSSNHCNYYSAWRFVTKEDVAYCQSEDHPDLINTLEPRTALASQAKADEHAGTWAHAREEEEETEIDGIQCFPSCSLKRHQESCAADGLYNQ